MQQTVDGETTIYTLDLAGGLTQVLSDGVPQGDDNNTYLYGVGRIGEYAFDSWAYHQHDALGSVRQLTDTDGAVTLTKSYMPYGEEFGSSGVGASRYGFTGEMADIATGLIYLRARFYAPWDGRFLTQDPWSGDSSIPMSFNGWLYGYANPVMVVDPSGMVPLPEDPCDRLPPEDARHCRLAMACKNPLGQKCPSTWIPSSLVGNHYRGEQFFHLLKQCPGWWHDEYDMYNDRQVMKLALAMSFKWELGTHIISNAPLKKAIGEAMAHKYWFGIETEGGFPEGGYWWLGSRKSMVDRLQAHYDHTRPFDQQTDTAKDTEFNLAIHEVRNVFGIYYGQNGNMRAYQHRPFSWGNPPDDRPELLYPKPAKEGVCPGQVYDIGGNSNGIVDPNEACVLTFHQDKCFGEPTHLPRICTMPCGEYKSLYYPELLGKGDDESPGY